MLTWMLILLLILLLLILFDRNGGATGARGAKSANIERVGPLASLSEAGHARIDSERVPSLKAPQSARGELRKSRVMERA